MPISKDALPSALDTAVARAAGWLLARQHKDGHWVFELEADATIPAEYVLLQHYLDTIDVELEGLFRAEGGRRPDRRATHGARA
jgi:squalene-hopene/tetraprenyl-beta-curcumene cyclase